MKTSRPQLQTLECRRLLAAMIQVIDSTGDVGQYTSIAINPVTQNPAIAYYDVTDGDLKYATFNRGRWVIDTIARTGNVGRSASLKFNSKGEPSIAFADSTHKTL